MKRMYAARGMACVGLGLVMTCGLRGQVGANDGKPESPQLSSETNLVVVRVVVRDGHGVPVTGLKKDDFKLFDRGKEQEVGSFEEEPGPGTVLRSGQRSAAMTTSTTETKPAGSSREARRLALFFDSVHGKAADLMHARDAANAFLDHHVQGDDQVAILTSDQLLTDFTSDAAAIHAALGQLNGSSTVQTPVRLCPDLSEYQARELLRDNDISHSSAWQLAGAEIKQCSGSTTDPKAPLLAWQVSQIRAMARTMVDEAAERNRGDLGQLENVVKYLSKFSGQRTLVLVSAGFLAGDEQDRVEAIIDRALRAQVVVNVLDPKGLEVMMRELDASRGTSVVGDERARAATYTLDRAQESESSGVLQELAAGTGGRFFHNDNDLGEGFAALAGHPDEYVLTFTPKELRLDGKFHELKVTLASRPKGYSIEARKGYFANKNPVDQAFGDRTQKDRKISEEAKAPGSASAGGSAGSGSRPATQGAGGQPARKEDAAPKDGMDEQLRGALQGDKDSDQLPIGMKVQAVVNGQLPMLIHLDVRPLAFRQEGDRSLNTVTFAVAVLDHDGRVGTIKQRVARLNLTSEQLAGLKEDGLELTITVPVQAGADRVRAVVMESEQHKVGSLTKSIPSE